MTTDNTTNDEIDGQVQPINKFLVAVRIRDQWGFALNNENYDPVWPPMYDSFVVFFHGLIAVQFDGQWGFLNEQGREVVEPRYEAIEFESADPLIRVVREGKVGFINRRADEVITCQYAACTEFNESGFAAYQDESELWGLLRLNGQPICPAQYDHINANSAYDGLNMFLVGRSNLYGLLNEQGAEVIPCMYDDCTGFRNNAILVQRDDHWAIVTLNHQFITDFDFTNWNDTQVKTGWLLEKAGKWGFVNEKGEEIIPIQYEAIHELAEGVFAVLDTNGLVSGFDAGGNLRTLLPELS
ncbi:hypothetical protein GCM10023187_52700 [Nibrella viscosa]|uniref:WG containing repeat-containing protein n=1 Tax=Nibrella viscosa TaxID=1084524 RepID=A0ABP8KXV9_9BACT